MGKHSLWVRKVAGYMRAVLLNRLEEGKTGTITYGESAKLVRKKSAKTEPGGELKVLPCRLHRSLGLLQELCRERNLPCLPSLVVGKKTRIPGEGFYKAYAELDWQDQVEYPAILENDERMRQIAEAEQEACCKRKHEDWKELREALDTLIHGKRGNTSQVDGRSDIGFSTMAS